MADPFSIAGSAVGIVSLGITVCQGLFQYYSACCDGPEDIKALRSSLAGLISTLDVLGRTMKDDRFDSTSRAHVQRCLADCDDAVQNLSRELNKVNLEAPKSAGSSSSSSGLSVRAKLGNTGKRLLYPFRESTLKKLRGYVEEMCENLSMAIGTVQLHTAAEALRKLDEIQAPVAKLSLTTTEIKESFDTFVATDKTDKAIHWLSATDPSSNHDAARKRWQPDTGLWLTGSSYYIEWREGRSPMIWLSGIREFTHIQLQKQGRKLIFYSGMWKDNSLAEKKAEPYPSSTVVEDVIRHRRNGAPVAYFYFDFRDSEKQTYEQALRSLLVQLCSRSSVALRVLQELHRRHEREQRTPTSEELAMSLKEVLGALPQTFIVLDALDECPERGELLNFLKTVAGQKVDNNIIVTSRGLADVTEAMDYVGARRVVLQRELVDRDIEAYVRTRLRVDKALKWPLNVQREIEQCLTQGAQGMFRWAYCQLEELCKCRTVIQVRTTLRSLPRTLDETYDRILTGISDADREYAFRALQWLAFAARPVSVVEVAEAMTVEQDCDLPCVNGDRALRDPYDLLDICTSLVSVSTGAVKTLAYDCPFDEYVDDDARDSEPAEALQLAHYSVKEYLVSDRIGAGAAAWCQLRASPAHRSIAECCLVFLLHFERLMPRDELAAQPVARYAAKYWAHHARQAADEESAALVLLATALLAPSSHHLRNWLRLYQLDKPVRRRREEVPEGAPLYYAACAGVQSLVRMLVGGGADVNARGGHFGTALHAASYFGHFKAAQLLLDRGADVNANAGHLGRALLAASRKGHLEVVRLLLDYGADLNGKGREHATALVAASHYGHLDVVRLLLDKGADIDSQADPYGSALQIASFNGHLEVVRLLLDRGADVNRKGGTFGTALMAASVRGQLDLVWLLLAKGANVNGKGGFYGTALVAASTNGRLDVVRLLLDEGADVNCEGNHCGTALGAAAKGGHLVARLLLERGASVDAAEHLGASALHIASRAGHLEVVRLLLDKGVEVNSLADTLHSTLQAASGAGHFDIARLLLEKGADVNAGTVFHRSALQAASGAGHIAVARLLLDAGADVSSNLSGHGSALRAASFNGHIPMVPLLLENAADVNAEGYFDGYVPAEGSGCSFTEQVWRLRQEDGVEVLDRITAPQVTPWSLYLEGD